MRLFLSLACACFFTVSARGQEITEKDATDAKAAAAASIAVVPAVDPQIEARYDEALALYKKGDYRAAATKLESIVGSTKSEHMQAKYHKLLGMTLQKLGRLKAAAANLLAALEMDPTQKVEVEETEEEVVPEAPRATLKVKATPANTMVLIDGILVGDATDVLDVEPGNVEVEFVSEGYEGQKKKVELVKGRLATVEVELKKAKPAPATDTAMETGTSTDTGTSTATGTTTP